MAYAPWSVTFGEQPSASKWNVLGTNDASFNDGSGIANDAVKSAKLFYGLIRNRQGSTTGDNTWLTNGTNNTATDGKDVFIQVGSVAGSSGGTVTVTFPTAFTVAPLVLATNNTLASNAANPVIHSISASQFVFTNRDVGTGSNTNEGISWLAVGQ